MQDAILRFQSVRTRRPAARFPWRLALLSCLLAGCAILCVFTRHQVMTTGYRLSQSNQQLETLRIEHESLVLERARLRSPASLMAQAARFGLGEPVQVIKVPHAAP